MSVQTASLRELVEACRNGEFYEDYDKSMDLLGRADHELIAIEQENSDSRSSSHRR